MALNGWHLSRRSLLKMSGQSLLAAGVAQAGALYAFVKPRRGLESATAESFMAHVGRTLVFLKPAEERGAGSATVELKLKSVEQHEYIARLEAGMPGTYGKRKRDSFTLLFEKPGSEPLSAGLHEFAQGEFKGCPVFLSRVGGGKKGPLRYEAVFG